MGAPEDDSPDDPEPDVEELEGTLLPAAAVAAVVDGAVLLLREKMLLPSVQQLDVTSQQYKVGVHCFNGTHVPGFTVPNMVSLVIVVKDMPLDNGYSHPLQIWPAHVGSCQV